MTVLDVPRFDGVALCAEIDPELWFPEQGGSSRSAKQVCTSCEVRTQCLEYALDNDERFGVWGGLSERERRRLKRSSGDPAPRATGRPVQPIKHGTEYGYKRCSAQPGGACPTCRQANTERTQAKEPAATPVAAAPPATAKRRRRWTDDELRDAVEQLRGYGMTFGEMATELQTSIGRVRAVTRRAAA